MTDKEQSIFNLKHINSNYLRSDILKRVNNLIWDYKEFTQWPGSIDKHHSYPGGLVIHTDEVWNYALNTASNFDVDLDVLFTSILWHDLAKIWDYKFVRLTTICLDVVKGVGPYEIDGNAGLFIKSDYHANVHHITGSIAEFTRHALNEGLDRSTLEKIQHCIAGHHGFPEWRSPVTPKSIEAILLHYSDTLSALHGKTK